MTFRALIAASTLMSVLGLAGAVKAQDPLPSVRIGTAAFITPANARTFYGNSTTHTDGPGAPTVAPPEIVELARALDGDVDLIFAFVRNQIDTEFRYGMSKGALGALIDRSGTPFDQAALFVELIRAVEPDPENPLQARYESGDITLTAAQFTQWSGISNPTAACQLLSSGAIPGAVNGSTTANCAYVGSLTSVQMSHAWASVQIGGVWYAFDPSFKTYSQPAGLNLPSIIGMAPGAPLAEASTGMSSGTASGTTVPYVQNLNAEDLNDALQGYTTALATHLQVTAPGMEFEDVVGEPLIVRWAIPPGGQRETSLPYGPPSPTAWTEVPNQYRSTLRVEGVYQHTTPIPMWDETFYADEIYGRRLAISSNFNAEEITQVSDYNTFHARLELDGAPIDTFTRSVTPTGWAGGVTLTLNHPYAPGADGSATLTGEYMDQTLEQEGLWMVLTTTIAHGWGWGGNGLYEAWSREAPSDTYLPGSVAHRLCEDGTPPANCTWGAQPSGDQTRNRMWAGWMGQSARYARIAAARANVRVERHHSLGWVVQNSETQQILGDAPPNTTDYRVVDGYTNVDVLSALSATSETALAADRNAAIRVIADGWALLEAAGSDQNLDTPDSSWAGGRLAWANRPELSQDPGGGAPRRIFGLTTANVPSLTTLNGMMIFENGYVDPDPETWINYSANWRWQNADLANDYVMEGYSVVVSAESFLGPGRRLGTGQIQVTPTVGSTWMYDPTPERGQAIVAVRSDGSGAPVEIAHVITTVTKRYKGGGGPSNPWQQAMGGQNTAADLLRSRFVDRSVSLGVNPLTGTASWEAPARLTVGVGEFPYAISAGFTFKPGYQPPPVPGVLPTAGWLHDWMWALTISASANEGMGQSGVVQASGLLAAIEASLDTYRQTYSVQREMTAMMIADWWRRGLVGNTATVTRGGSGQQYVRLPDGSYVSPNGAASVRLVQNFPRVAALSPCAGAGQPGMSLQATSRIWDLNVPGAVVGFSLTGAEGDVQSWSSWEDIDGPVGTGPCSYYQGTRLNQWDYPSGVRVTLTPGITTGMLTVSNNLGRSLEVAPWEISDSHGREITSAYTLSPTLPVYFDGALATDAMGQTWRFELGLGPGVSTPTVRAEPGMRLLQLFEPGETDASLRYAYDGVGRINTAWDAFGILEERQPYTFFLAAGTRSVRIDPLGGRFTTWFDSWHNNRAYQVTDEVGATILTSYDGRDRVVSRTYPEGDREEFTYDIRDNMLTLTRVAEPGSGLANLTSAVTYVEGPTVRVCTAAATCNRPASTNGPRTDVVDVSEFDWNAQGQLIEAEAPADANGNRPLTTLTYSTFATTGPTLHLPYQRTERISLSDSVVTEYGYDATANFVLRTVTVDPGGLNLRTCYQYSPVGDIVGVADPRQATCPPTVVP